MARHVCTVPGILCVSSGPIHGGGRAAEPATRSWRGCEPGHVGIRVLFIGRSGTAALRRPPRRRLGPTPDVLSGRGYLWRRCDCLCHSSPSRSTHCRACRARRRGISPDAAKYVRHQPNLRTRAPWTCVGRVGCNRLDCSTCRSTRRRLLSGKLRLAGRLLGTHSFRGAGHRAGAVVGARVAYYRAVHRCAIGRCFSDRVGGDCLWHPTGTSTGVGLDHLAYSARRSNR